MGVCTYPACAGVQGFGVGQFRSQSCDEKLSCVSKKGRMECVVRDLSVYCWITIDRVWWGRTFADGFPNLFVPNAHGIRGQHVAFLASFSSPAVIFEQLSIIYALPRMFVSSFTLVLPFFPTGTLERMEDEGDIATAFTLARILSNIPISRGGPTSLVIFDIHALQVSTYLMQHIFFWMLQSIISFLWVWLVISVFVIGLPSSHFIDRTSAYFCSYRMCFYSYIWATSYFLKISGCVGYWS